MCRQPCARNDLADEWPTILGFAAWQCPTPFVHYLNSEKRSKLDINATIKSQQRKDNQQPQNLRAVFDLIASQRRGNDSDKDHEHEGHGAHGTEG